MAWIDPYVYLAIVLAIVDLELVMGSYLHIKEVERVALSINYPSIVPILKIDGQKENRIALLNKGNMGGIDVIYHYCFLDRELKEKHYIFGRCPSPTIGHTIPPNQESAFGDWKVSFIWPTLFTGYRKIRTECLWIIEVEGGDERWYAFGQKFRFESQREMWIPTDDSIPRIKVAFRSSKRKTDKKIKKQIENFYPEYKSSQKNILNEKIIEPKARGTFRTGSQKKSNEK